MFSKFILILFLFFSNQLVSASVTPSQDCESECSECFEKGEKRVAYEYQCSDTRNEEDSTQYMFRFLSKWPGVSFFAGLFVGSVNAFTRSYLVNLVA